MNLAQGAPCNKVCFRTEKDAEWHVEKIKRTSKSGVSGSTYYCFDCKSWHITSQEKRLITKLRNCAVENAALKKQIVDLMRDENKEIQKDAKVKEWQKKYQEQGKKLGELRKTISSLINKLVMLEEKQTGPLP